MPDEAEGRNPVDALAEEFLERYRCGERPPLTEYVRRHPELAGEIRELFPALVIMEEAGPRAPAGPAGGAPRGSDGQVLTRLGDFRVLREVGRGGMGIVYEAEQESLGRRVALKVLPVQSASDPTRLERFRREARAAARLHHSHIVPIYEVGEHQGVHYYAMQFIRGHALDQVLKEVRRYRAREATTPDDALSAGLAGSLLTGRFVVAEPAARPGPSSAGPPTVDLRDGPAPAPLRPERDGTAAEGPDSATAEFSSAAATPYYRSVARLGAQAADALAYAHEQKVLHRDVKPANLVLDVHGLVWVTDFGLAKTEDEDLTRTGDLVGTLRYMAPERFSGLADARSDVYSLGLTLYEMLALAPAFDESDRALLIRRVTNEEPPRPRRLDPKIPRDLETVVLKAIAREPGRRYRSAAELAEDLRRFLNDQPIRARHITAVERLWRWARREPRLAATAGAVVVLIGLVIAVLWTSNAKIGAEANNARKAEADARTAEAEKTLQLGLSLLKQGTANQTTGQAGQRFDSLDLLRQAADTLRSHPRGGEYLAEARDQMTAALALTDLRRVWERDLGKFMWVSCDAALERYAVDEPCGGDIVVRRLDSGEEIQRLTRPPDANFWHMSHDFSPDGRYFWVSYRLRGGEPRFPSFLLHVWDLGRKESVLTAQTRCSKVCFHPDGKRLLYSNGLEVVVWDLEARRERRRLPLGLLPYDLALSPDGSLVVGNWPESIMPILGRHSILEVETGRERLARARMLGTRGISWRADGQVFAVASDRGGVEVFTPQPTGAVTVLKGHTAEVLDCRFAPAGNLLATWGWDDTKFWDVATGELLVTVPGRFVRFSPDGRRIALLEGTRLGIWDLAHGQECRRLHLADQGNNLLWNGTPALGADFSPDGRFLVVAQGWACLYDTATGWAVGEIKTAYGETVRFHPEGHTLAVHSVDGVHLWPVQSDDRGGRPVLRLGPPRLMNEGPFDGWRRLTWLPGGKGLAAVDNPHGRVLLLDPSAPKDQAELKSIHKRLTSITVSPDGRWAAGGGWKEPRVQVWDLATRQLVQRLPANDGSCEAHTLTTFSPDGRWLVSACRDDHGDRFTFWRTGTWEQVRVIPQEGRVSGWAPPAFTADGRLMALAISPRRVLIAESETGRTVGFLSTPQDLAPTPLAFSRDGTRLAAATNRPTVLLWDLRRVRATLADAGLDWQADPLPARGEDENPRPLEVVVEGGPP